MSNPITIAIASGKGGTGKTTLSVNLAACSSSPITLLDCDVEEPNAHLFLAGQAKTILPFYVKVPQFDEALCNGCDLCAKACHFQALIVLGNKPILFPELCHSCGNCVRVCSNSAVKEINRQTGVIERSQYNHIQLMSGRLNVGEAKSPPLIRAIRQYRKLDEITLIDAPPGTSCPVISAVADTNYLVLVTEPTPFGLNDLALAVEMARALRLRFGVVINRSDIGNNAVRGYCNQESIPILAEFPFDRKVAECYSTGSLLVERLPEYREQFIILLERLIKEASR